MTIYGPNTYTSVSPAILQNIWNECFPSDFHWPRALLVLDAVLLFLTLTAIKTGRLSQLMHSSAQGRQRGSNISLAHRASPLQRPHYLNTELKHCSAEQQYQSTAIDTLTKIHNLSCNIQASLTVRIMNYNSKALKL